MTGGSVEGVPNYYYMQSEYIQISVTAVYGSSRSSCIIGCYTRLLVAKVTFHYLQSIWFELYSTCVVSTKYVTWNQQRNYRTVRTVVFSFHYLVYSPRTPGGLDLFLLVFVWIRAFFLLPMSYLSQTLVYCEQRNIPRAVSATPP